MPPFASFAGPAAALGVVALFPWLASTRFRGRIPTYLGLGFVSLAAASFTLCVLSLLVHPGWDTANHLRQVSGRGGIIVGFINLAIAIGPKGVALGVAVLVVAFGAVARAQLAAIRSGDFRSAAEVERDAKEMQRFVALMAEIKSEQNLLAARHGTFASREEEAAVHARAEVAKARIPVMLAEGESILEGRKARGVP